MLNTSRQEGDRKKSASGSGQISPPSVSLPKGGGAVRGIEEKYSVNPVTGSASFSIPVFTSPGRSGFQPELSLSYDSGSGNSPFGLGWSLSIPSITRKTAKGLPLYKDEEESDVFILSGSEDLVPVLEEKGGEWERKVDTRADCRVYYYRPRIEGLFARIEKWVKNDGNVYWRTISRDNITTCYGKTEKARISDGSRVFQWLIEESRDDRGNVMAYEYKKENDQQVDRSLASEKNRIAGGAGFTNRYIKRIKYCNRTPYSDDFLMEVVFDYGEHGYAINDDNLVECSINDDVNEWTCRPDAFSTYKAGFEIRTYRLCQRVLMFHRFSELGDSPCLVRSTDFNHVYNTTSCYTCLASVTQTGYVRDSGAYRYKSLPETEFTYSLAEIQNEVKSVDSGTLENLPAGIDGSTYRLVDLDGEGLPGILTEQAGEWYYKRNLGDAEFSPLNVMSSKPRAAGIATGHQLMDLAGDGRLDLVALDERLPGFYERTDNGKWTDFRSFTDNPNIDWQDPNLRFIDLTGDGSADILISGDEVFTWYPSEGEDGFGRSETVRKALDEEKGPALVFSELTQSVYLADMSGDGLPDLCRIRNGEVCYWPNLGYGRFGAKVTMDNPPQFDTPDQFDQRRIRLADIDGTGTTDIIYLGRDVIKYWFNRSGNGWTPKPGTIAAFPETGNLSDVIVTDLLGKGTACLVWSSPLPSDAGSPLKYLDLMGEKPHLMKSVVNNMGKETRLTYAQSTKFYLEDKYSGSPWITRLPFPVHVVEKIETYDRISRNRFVTRYAYHHGYFDGEEREFRGFGMVEQWDTEEYETLKDAGLAETSNLDASSHVPPVLTRTWFHTGACIRGGRISRHFEDEYYREGDPGSGEGQLTDAQLEAMLLPDTLLPGDLTPEEEREACRALKGSVLRLEVYGLDRHPDGSPAGESDRPYTVSERNYTVKCLQPKGSNRHAVFFVHERETVDFQYERRLVDTEGVKRADPRITHSIRLKVDDYGNVEREVSIGYRRRPMPGILDEQEQTHLTLTAGRFANRADEEDWYRVGQPVETRTFEVVNPPEPTLNDGIVSLFAFKTIDELVESLFPGDTTRPEAAKTWPYERWDWRGNPAHAPSGTRLRLIEHLRTYYRKDDLSQMLPLGRIESMAIPGETYKLAFTPGLAKESFADSGRASQAELDAALADEGGYVHTEGDANWWIPSGRIFYSPDPGHTPSEELNYARRHFFLQHRYRDPFHIDGIRETETFVSYDTYDLLVVETRDALDNTTMADNDYRVLQPFRVTDPNGNRSEAAFDTLGLVVATAVMGKVGEDIGDLLEGLDTDPSPSVLDGFFDNPYGHRESLLGGATTRFVYDLYCYPRYGSPPFVATLVRETHLSDLEKEQKSKIQVSFSYFDGFGQTIQKKIEAEPGPVPLRNANGKIIVGLDGQPEMSAHNVHPRWVGSGWTVFNNKGKPVRRYEPFFSDTHKPDFDTKIGTSPIIFYDPIGRVVATLHPNHTYEKVVFDPWHQETWDVNDTVLQADPGNDVDVGGFFERIPDSDYLPSWYDSRINGQKGPAEKSAAEKAALHNGTPAIAFFDSLGRTFLTVEDNGQKGKYKTRTHPDIEGNQRMVIDAKKRIVMQYDYDMLGNRIHQASMEAGERWMLNDVAGKPIYGWDSRGHRTRITYDELQRPTGLYVSVNGGPEVLAEKTVYGESLPNPEQFNHRGRIYQVYDGAGVVTNEMYDFKGNQLSSRRQLLRDYRNRVDWAQSPSLEPEIFTGNTQFDALNRAVQIVAPRSDQGSDNINIIQPAYNEANLLERVDVWLGEGVIPQALLDPATANLHAVKDIDYDARGQRTRIEYGNGVITTYEYDPYTFRLIRLKTVRPHGGDILQDLQYAYDPAGNITSIRDDAQQTVYFNNQVVEPRADYTYDALYRLIEATGREHIGQVSRPETSWNDKNRTALSHPNDGRQMRNYTEKYEYDEVGNILNLIHLANGNGNWTRAYSYNEAGLIEPGKKNNRLSSTTVGDTTVSYEHDEHGNMTRMPHLPAMEWDFEDQLHVTQRQVVNNGNTAERTYYVYDAEGERVRKVTERQDHTPKYERIYLGGFEIYRDYKAGGTTIELERKTLHITDDRQRIAMIETKTIDTNNDPSPGQLIRYQLGNHLGSAGLELDDTGRVISYEEYYPYGSTSYQAVDKNIRAAAKRYRYTGKERDEETGLYYHGARYYACWLGRWTSADPEGVVDGVNLFNYSRNNPLKYIDLDGHKSLPPDPIKGVKRGLAPVIYRIKNNKIAMTPEEIRRLYSFRHLLTEQIQKKGGKRSHDMRFIILLAEWILEQTGRHSFYYPRGANVYNIQREFRGQKSFPRPGNKEEINGREVRVPAYFIDFTENPKHHSRPTIREIKIGVSHYFERYIFRKYEDAGRAILEGRPFEAFARGLRPSNKPWYKTREFKKHVRGLRARGREVINAFEFIDQEAIKDIDREINDLESDVRYLSGRLDEGSLSVRKQRWEWTKIFKRRIEKLKEHRVNLEQDLKVLHEVRQELEDEIKGEPKGNLIPISK